MIRIALGLSLLLTACASTGTQTTEASPDQASESPAGSGEAETSESSTSGSGEVRALCQGSCVLEPGTYSAAPFEPAFTFTVPDNGAQWRLEGVSVRDVGLQLSGLGGIIWAVGVTSGTVGGAPVVIEPTAGGFVAFLQSLAATGMTVSAPTPTTVDLVEGQQIDVTTNDVPESRLFALSGGVEFYVRGEEELRFIVMDHNGVTVVLILEAYKEADFDEWLETAAPVVESIRWA